MGCETQACTRLDSPDTATETVGTDADGKTHATRETKSGEHAANDVESIMNKMLGGIKGCGSYMHDLFAPPHVTAHYQQQPDPVDELAALGFGGGWGKHQTADQVLRLRDASRDPTHPAHKLHKRCKDNHRHHGINLDHLLAEMADMTRPVARFLKPIKVRVMHIPDMLFGNPLPGHTLKRKDPAKVPNGKSDDGKCCKVKPDDETCCEDEVDKNCCKDPAKSSCAHA